MSVKEQTILKKLKDLIKLEKKQLRVMRASRKLKHGKYSADEIKVRNKRVKRAQNRKKSLTKIRFFKVYFKSDSLSLTERSPSGLKGVDYIFKAQEYNFYMYVGAGGHVNTEQDVGWYEKLKHIRPSRVEEVSNGSFYTMKRKLLENF